MQLPISELVKYYLKGKTIYKVHSPFLFPLLGFIKDRSRQYYAFADIEMQRHLLLQNNTSIDRKDYGAGSKNSKSSQRSIRAIASTDLSSLKQCQEIFRLIDFAQAENILELGTSLGISTAYLASANRQSRVNTVEGDEALITIARDVASRLNLDNIRFHNAKFQDYIADEKQRYHVIFIDGHHLYKPTVNYALQLEKNLSNTSFMLIDDIFWSQGMNRAWNELVQSGKWPCSLAFHNYGILIKNPSIKKPLHINYLPVWAKPWQMRFSI